MILISGWPLVAIALLVLAGSITDHPNATSRSWQGVGIIMMIVGPLPTLFVIGRIAQRALLAGIQKHRLKLGHCIFCNHDLRGTNSDSCPECGWNRSERQEGREA